MDCDEFRRIVCDDLDVESALSGDAAAHVRGCDACRSLADAAKRLRRDLELERSLAPAGTVPLESGEGGGAPAFELLLAAWRSGRAEQVGGSSVDTTRPSLRSSPWRRVAAAAAILLAGVALGGFLTWSFLPGRTAAPPMAPVPTVDSGPRFLLALYEHGSVVRDPQPDIEQRVVGEYVAWARSLEKSGHYDTADRLREDSRALLRLVSGKVFVDTEPLDPDERRLGGFFLIKANSLDEAILLARSCPHLRYGGEIEVREIARER